MSQSVERFIIPFNSIGYELRPSATARGFHRTVKKVTKEVMGLDIDTVKKEITVMTEKLTERKKKLKYLEAQATRSSKTAIAYHAAKHFVQSVVGTKKSDAKQASHVEHADSSPERDEAEEGAIVGVDQHKTVPDQYDPTSETPEHKGKGGMSTPKSGHEKKGSFLQKIQGKAAKLLKKPKATPHNTEQTPGGHAHQSLTKWKKCNFLKTVKGKFIVVSKFRKKKH